MLNILCVVFLVLVFSVSPMVLPRDGRGDPAPGRSPGPPTQQLISSGLVSSSEISPAEDEIINETWSWCSDKVRLTETHQLTLYHPKFATHLGIVAGLYYQVAIKPDKNVRELFVWTDVEGEWMGETYLHNCGPKHVPSRNGAVKLLTERVPLSWKMVKAQEVNITFSVMGRTADGDLFNIVTTIPTIAECSMQLKASRGSLSSTDLPETHICSVTFPEDYEQEEPSKRRGLLVQLTRLNVPCLQGGFVQLSGVANRQPRRLCGKLEELGTRDRTFHFPAETLPSVRLVRRPVFSLNYTTVDFCYNVTLTAENGSVVLTPTDTLYCHFRVHLPYGYRIRLLLQVGEEPTTTVASRNDVDTSLNTSSCDGLWVVVSNGESDWTHCSRYVTPKPNVEVESVGNVVTVHVMAAGADRYPSLRFWYSAVSVPEVVGACRFGEVSIRKYCVSAVHTLLSWSEAEAHCAAANGHLLSIRDEHAQFVVDSLLLKSPPFLDHDSYWIGASDWAYEGHFQWSDGHAFSYSNWFPGWQQHGFHYRQPNDDGFSQQDCVEVRRSFPAPAPAGGIAPAFTSSYLWNDLDCSTPNYFLCERLRSEDTIEESWRSDCNRTITLTREHPRAVVSSPGFPYHYPDNMRCLTTVLAPDGYHIILDFEELVLEKEPTYDYLEITEVPEKAANTTQPTVYCGDMSDKLKLLRYASNSATLQLLFVSDYSHHLGGFKARVSIENAKKECADENHKMFNNYCYLFVGFPKVTWQTALQICSGMKAQLASITNGEEQAFVTSNLRKSMEYSTSSVFWLGGFVTSSDQWAWVDNEPMEFSAWPPNDTMDNMVNKEPSPSCLGLQWVSSIHSSFSGLYWAPKSCNNIGGYVCKKPIAGTSLDLSKTLNGSDGYVTSPGHPGTYRPDLDYEVRIIGPVSTRLVITMTKMDIEHQPDCLYDFIEIRSGAAVDPEQRWCGTWNIKLHPFHFVSTDNEAFLRFRSDYSVSGSGFAATWRAIDVTGCPSQTLTAREGILSSPNYPDFLLPGLDCTTIILAAPGKRVWLELTELSLGEGGNLELNLGADGPTIRPHFTNGSIGGGNFVSLGEKLLVRLNTSAKTSGAGFRAIYRSVNSVHEERIVDLAADTNGVLYHLNYPAPPPLYVDFIQHFVAPLGFAVFLEFHKVVIVSGPSCPDGRGVIEVNDNYADVNGTWWFLCPVDDLELQSTTPIPPIAITSYLHTLHVRQRSLAIGLLLNATLRVREDPQFKLKILRLPDETNVETCRPNPCLNGGKCLNSAVRKTCQCTSHFTGLFCALTQCELEPCLFGVCELTTNGYHCRCQAGYTGQFCDSRQRPCADNPCEGRGECSERGDAFHCLCHAWWEGPRCERKMMHIPYKPLSERMLQEPFWLGLITVFVVLGVIGLFWCAKRHFPEKLEKLLAEEADRHGRSHVSAGTRPSSARDMGTGASVSLQSPSAPSCPRSLFGRLGIRKPSLLSLSSPTPASVPPAAPRTFSLDDLLRPTPRRSPSPRKKRTNSTPTKKNVADKKQILQQLISPSTSAPPTNKVKLNELIQLRETTKSISTPADGRPKTKETSFSAPDVVSEDRFEKKVTFARLLNKVSAEMSTSSEADISKAPLTRAVSTPASPAANRSNYIDHREDSLSSSEVTISGGASILDIPSTSKRPTRLNCPSNRNPSADSLLAMFRNMSAQSNAPSPLDDSFCSDESLAVDTPVSTSSGPSDSPKFGITIEIPVVDSQKSNYLQPPSIHLELPQSINKCLSPIREVPTPLSSPALTPILHRMGHESKTKIESSEDDKAEEGGDDTDDGSNELLVEIHHDGNFSDEGPVLVIPLLTVEEPSPKKEIKTIPVFTFTGSPPPQKKDSCNYPPQRSPTKKFLKEFEKPTSLDLPHPPPMILVTCNASDGESDTESVKQTQLLNPTINSAGMNYLSPFSMCSRNDRTASESNLSSSGYSSMASPGPSRCGSNNPLCLSEVEDHSQPPSRRPSPLLRSPAMDEQHHSRRRSDSETLSDDPLLESNDEGIGTDHLDEKPEDPEAKTKESQNVLDFHVLAPIPPPRGVLKKCDNLDVFSCPITKSSLQLPTIVVQSDFCDKMLSPVSSRSESPLSDKTLGLGRFSPMFYCKNKNEQLPFTDSDGLYDFPSSDCPPSKNKSVQACTAPHRKRRDRRANKTPSPTKTLTANAVAPTKDNASRSSVRKPSPKRRSRAQAPPPSSSSSSESLTFGKGNISIRLTAPDGTEWPVRSEKLPKAIHPTSQEASGEDTAEEVTDGLVSSQEDLTRAQKNINRLRSIGNQIRFLRRIEMSLRRKDRAVSPSHSDSNGEDEEMGECSSTALLKRPMHFQELRKSSSALCLAKRQRSGKKRGIPLLRPFSNVAISHGQTD